MARLENTTARHRRDPRAPAARSASPYAAAASSNAPALKRSFPRALNGSPTASPLFVIGDKVREEPCASSHRVALRAAFAVASASTISGNAAATRAPHATAASSAA